VGPWRPATAGAILARHRGWGGAITAWQLRCLPVCASTERELDRWLAAAPPQEGEGGRLLRPRAVIAAQQRFGHGQRGRIWQAPPGGLWLSAALPWPADPHQGAAPALAVAVALAEALEAQGVPVALKWPNDLLLLTPQGPRKLAGLLPGLRRRGSRVRWARIGLGLNGHNPVPAGAANLRGHPRLRCRPPARLAALGLAVLERALALAPAPEVVRQQAERRLLRPDAPLELEGAGWWPEGLAADGGLRLVSGDGRRRTLHRF
jgi:BirA family biotin operon repressor/biotin-[acetyl-CoA-carboxylase] ligase